MFLNTGRNRGFLFITRTLISIPSPTGVMLVGVKLEGVGINTPSLMLDFNGQGLSTVDVDAIVAFVDANYGPELTWRILDLRGNAIITDVASYNSLVSKGFEVYGAVTSYIPEVATVLARMPNPLTDREIFAIDRLVSNSVTDGNWPYIDEMFALGLYDRANAYTGFIGKTITEAYTTPNHILGKGMEFNNGSSEGLNTNWADAVDGVNAVFDDLSVGAVGETYGILNAVHYYWQGGANYGYRLLTSFRYGGRLQGVNHGQVNGSNDIGKTRAIVLDRTPSNLSRGRTTVNNGSSALDSRSATIFSTNTQFIGTHTNGASPFNGIIKFWYAGGSFDTLNYSSWFTNQMQFVNELEIGKADLVDYNVINETYHWDERELLESQLEELAGIIDGLSDGTTTGRSLVITGNLGISTNAQTSLDSLVAKGWTIIY